MLQLYPARALRALGLLLADGIPQVEGGRLFEPSAGFFYGNSCNSGTESRKNRFQGGKLTVMSRAKKWVINENWGRMAKIGFLGQKLKFLAQKKAYTF